jgi:hypothetical protein
MLESEFDKINAVLDRAQFAIQQIQGKVDELTRKRAAAQTPEEIVAVDLMADELLLQLQKVGEAVHTGNRAPHLRLVSDTEQETFMDRRQPPPRRRLLKSGEILLGKHPVPCTIRNMSARGACLQVQTTAGIPVIFDFQRVGEPTARKCKTIWRDNTRIGVMFIEGE